MIQRETQARCLGVMIGRCSPNSQYGIIYSHSTSVGCSFSRYTNDDLKKHKNQSGKRKTWTREDIDLANSRP